MNVLRAAQQHRSDARVAEGGALLRRYTGKTRIEGSNPSLSAIPPFLEFESKTRSALLARHG